MNLAEVIDWANRAQATKHSKDNIISRLCKSCFGCLSESRWNKIAQKTQNAPLNFSVLNAQVSRDLKQVICEIRGLVISHTKELTWLKLNELIPNKVQEIKDELAVIIRKVDQLEGFAKSLSGDCRKEIMRRLSILRLKAESLADEVELLKDLAEVTDLKNLIKESEKLKLDNRKAEEDLNKIEKTKQLESREVDALKNGVTNPGVKM